MFVLSYFIKYCYLKVLFKLGLYECNFKYCSNFENFSKFILIRVFKGW